MRKSNGGNGDGNDNRRVANCGDKQLKPRERMLVEMLVDPLDPRPESQKALAAGYKNGKQVYEFVNRPHIARAIREASDRWMTSLANLRRPQVLKAVSDRAKKNSPPDARTFFQVTDDITTGTNLNLTQVQTNEAEVRALRKERLGNRVAALQDDS